MFHWADRMGFLQPSQLEVLRRFTTRNDNFNNRQYRNHPYYLFEKSNAYSFTIKYRKHQTRTQRRVIVICNSAPQVMINGLPGKMSTEVLQVGIERGLEYGIFGISLDIDDTICGLRIVPFSLTAETTGSNIFSVKPNLSIRLLKPSEREQVMSNIRKQYPHLIAVDYTHPDSVNSNALFYQRHHIPFVMGTTGGDREQLISTTQQAAIYALIAPNMGKPIVALQSILTQMAENFPNVFDNYQLNVVESHQQSKADTSGTAKEIIQSFLKMGAKFDQSKDLQMIRNPKEQLENMKIPAEYLNGHAFHTYRLTSADKTVEIAFQHNVYGRRIYANGTIDAVLFLWRKIEQQAAQKLYNMMDILKENASLS